MEKEAPNRRIVRIFHVDTKKQGTNKLCRTISYTAILFLRKMKLKLETLDDNK